jgi:serine/threonine-protein kinase RsbW
MIEMIKDEWRLPSTTENISVVENLVDQVCDAYQINDDYYGNILIALTEAVTNAIQHGNKSNPNKFFDIKFKKQQDKLLFLVKDEGEGFDYNNLPDPTDPKNIEKIHGRGIYLMKHLADDVSFHDDGRGVELIFSLHAN